MELCLKRTITLTVAVLIFVGSSEGKPVGKILGKRSVSVSEIGDSSEDSNSFTDKRSKNNKVAAQPRRIPLNQNQLLLLRELLAKLPEIFSENGDVKVKGVKLTSQNSGESKGVEKLSFPAKMLYRYKKRVAESLVPSADSNASARAAFMQARRRMGPEFNPTGW